MATTSEKSYFAPAGLALKIAKAMEEAGWTPQEMNSLAEEPESLRRFREAKLGHAEIVAVKHVIDCDADPFVPEGWSVEEHRKGGQFEWNPDKVRLHLSPNQMNGKVIDGNELHKELASEPTLNANVLDYLLKHPHLIPEEWKGKYVFFWGTIYRSSGGSLCVRCLSWNGGGWGWGWDWLGGGWGDHDPAALLASST